MIPEHICHLIPAKFRKQIHQQNLDYINRVVQLKVKNVTRKYDKDLQDFLKKHHAERIATLTRYQKRSNDIISLLLRFLHLFIQVWLSLYSLEQLL